MIYLKKSQTVARWEQLLMAMLGEQFMVSEEICGAVVAVRYQVCK